MPFIDDYELLSDGSSGFVTKLKINDNTYDIKDANVDGKISKSEESLKQYIEEQINQAIYDAMKKSY